MASDRVYGARVTSVAGIFILSLTLQSSNCELPDAGVIPGKILQPVINNEDITQQQPVLPSNNQADQNESNLIPEVLSEDYEKLKFLTGDGNDDVRSTFMTILKDIYKRYEDLKNIYNIVMKIHEDILNSKDNINKKFSSLVSNEATVSDILTKLSTLEKELSLKQQNFLWKQKEFDEYLKTFKERQLSFEKKQLRLVEEDQRIIQNQNELSRKQEVIINEQKYITVELKNVIQKLKEYEDKQNHTSPTTNSTYFSTTTYKLQTKINQSTQSPIEVEKKETESNFPFIAAETIQEILKNKFENDDIPKTFAIKVKTSDLDKNTDQEFIDELQVENIEASSYSEVEDLIKNIYSNHSYVNKMLQDAQKELIVPDKVFQLVKVDTNSALGGPRMKRSLDNAEIAHKNNRKFKKRRHRGLKKYHHPIEKKRALEKAAAKEEPTTFKYETQSIDSNTLLAQSYCNQIGQNNNKMSFNHCINKFLNWNQGADVGPPKTKPTNHHVVPSVLERVSNVDITNSSAERFYHRKQNIESSIQVTETAIEPQQLTTIEVRETTTERNLTTPSPEDDTEREQELSVEIFDTDQRLPTIVIDRKEVQSGAVRKKLIKVQVNVHKGRFPTERLYAGPIRGANAKLCNLTAKSVNEMRPVDDDEQIDDAEGNIYWDDTVGTIKTPAKENDAMDNSYSDGEDYAILDADALVLLSKRREYVERYNSRILASASKKDDKKKEKRRKEKKNKEDKRKDETKKEDKNYNKKKEDKGKDKHDRRRKI